MWTYEQLFNSLNTADLNGQDSWSGDAIFDVVTTSPYEGAKCVQSVLNSDAFKVIKRAITGISSGTVYASIKINRTAGMRRASLYLYSGTTEVARVMVVYDGASNNKIYMLTNSGGAWEVIGTMPNNTWVRIGIDFDDSAHNNQYRVNVDGGAWSSWYGYYMNPSWTTINTIGFSDDGNNGSGSGTIYWDTVSPNYTPGVSVPTNPAFLLAMV